MGLSNVLVLAYLLSPAQEGKEPPPLSRFGDYSPEKVAESYLGAQQDDPLLPARPQEEPRQEEPRLTPPEFVPSATSWRLEWFPGTVLYRNYLADPVSPRSGSKMMFPIHQKHGHVKIENCLGTQRTLFRALNAEQTEGFDLSVEGAVISQFDYTEDWDMDSADYRFGFPFGYRLGNVSGKFHVWHLTSHLGDEYMSRNETTESIRYHKEELAIGLAYDFTPEARVYVDGGYGIYIGKEGTKRWRGQMGAEWAGYGFGEDAPRTFVACDVKYRQEAERTVSLDVQAGLWLAQDKTSSTAGFRIFLEYYRGNSAQTQFPDDKVQYWAFGFGAAF